MIPWMAEVPMAKKRRRKIAMIGRLGPATNLRPAGAHESLKRYNRKRQKAALQRDAASGFELSRENDSSVD